MKKTYGVTISMTGTQYVEVYCEEDDAEDMAWDEMDPSKVGDWETELYEVVEVDDNE